MSNMNDQEFNVIRDRCIERAKGEIFIFDHEVSQAEIAHIRDGLEMYRSAAGDCILLLMELDRLRGSEYDDVRVKDEIDGPSERVCAHCKETIIGNIYNEKGRLDSTVENKTPLCDECGVAMGNRKRRRDEFVTNHPEHRDLLLGRQEGEAMD